MCVCVRVCMCVYFKAIICRFTLHYVVDDVY